MSIILRDEQQTVLLANQLACNLAAPAVIYFQGDLGAGKTTFIRAMLQSLGYTGSVKSPTFTLIEPYSIRDYFFYHLDLYRLSTPKSVLELGLRDYLQNDSILLIEWPERGEGFIPPADLICQLKFDGIERTITFIANSEQGQKFLKNI